MPSHSGWQAPSGARSDSMEREVAPTDAQRPSPAARQSRRLLWLAVATTAVVTIAGSAVVWHLFVSTFARPDAGGSAASPPAGDPLTVVVGRTPGGPSEWIAYAAVFAQLQKDLGRPVKVRYVLDRDDSADLVRSGAADIALVASRVYIDLARDGAAVLVAAPVVAGQPGDAAVLVVSAASSFQTLEDLRGRRLVLAPGSLAGRSFAVLLVQERAGTPLEEFFGSVVEAGEQDANLTAVAKGEADATALRRTSLATWPEGTFRVVTSSPEFGTPPIVARRGLDEATIARVRESLLTMQARGVIPSSGSALTGFVPARDSDYDYLRLLEEAGKRTQGGQSSGGSR